jgi:uncharacterized membrane protein YeaQ/YmgE (transglycosylase-associated protein family)
LCWLRANAKLLKKYEKENKAMGILSWIIVGLIAGWLAGLVMKGSGYGVIGDIILGIIGALIGGFLASALFGVAAPVNGVNVPSLIIAFIGAVIVVAIVRALPGRSSV